ncbi:hypothetical protein SAY87_027181 [Trapa incisa]|uniref:Protein ABIL2 n=1 Tax=Trapa incisa TaxID=236973 RepID=A0AAN7GYT8_9MYRT|nr:hypothetical protein SAY87_027181 [Trapa incisa]
MTASSSPVPEEASNYDEFSMHQSLMFSDSLKDLKNLRAQLYSAAEYFELSYTNDDQKQMVVETLKDYTVKALVNTVDHLGSVSYGVNDLLYKKVDEVAGTEISVSCIEQRLQACLHYIDHEGLTQQSLVINAPKFHMRYILPVGEAVCRDFDGMKLNYHGSLLDDGDGWHQCRNTVRCTMKEDPPPVSSSAPFRHQRSATFSFPSNMSKKHSDKRAFSPQHRFPSLHSGSITSRSGNPDSSWPSTPKTIRPTTPNLSFAGENFLSETRKLASVQSHAERDSDLDTKQYPSKSKHLLKALLSRRPKSKRDEMLYTYLDEY